MMQLSGLQLPEVTIEDLFKAQVHLGHRSRYRNSSMSVYCSDQSIRGLQVIDLDKTQSMLKKALIFLSSVVAKRGRILFVGTKKSAFRSIREQAVRCGMPYVDHRWIPGTLTNYNKILKPIKHLEELNAKIDSGYLDHLTKKEGLNVIRERDKLEHVFAGIKGMQGLPEVLFIVDVEQERIALMEAIKLKIPVVAIVDTNNSPKGVDCVIPGNDDSFKAVNLYAGLIADTVLETSRVVRLSLPAEEPLEEKTAQKVSVVKRRVVKRVVKVKDKDGALESGDQVNKQAAGKVDAGGVSGSEEESQGIDDNSEIVDSTENQNNEGDDHEA